MSFGAAKDAYFAVASPVGGTVYFDLSPYLTGADWTAANGVIDTSTFGKGWQTAIRGMSDATLSVDGIYDPAVGTVLKTLGTAGLTGYKYGPQGSGGQLFSGSCLVTSFNPPAKLDTAVTFTAAFKNSGTVTVA